MRFIEEKNNARIQELSRQGTIVNPGVISRLKISDNLVSEFSSGNIIALLGDSLRFLCGDHRSTPINIDFIYGQETINIIRQIIGATLYVTQIENIWEKCVWLNCEVAEEGAVTHLRCGDESIDLTVVSSEDRFYNNSSTIRAACCDAWKFGGIAPPKPIRWVCSATVGENEVLYVLSDWRKEDLPPEPYINRRSILAGIPEELLNIPLPKFNEITPSTMFDALEALQSLGELFFRRNVNLADELSPVWMDSPVISVKDCVRLVSEACRLEEKTAALIIDIFTLGGSGRDGAWEKPLIPAGNGCVYISFPVLLTTNLVRLLDHWLIVGGMNRKDKGSALEQTARKELIAALAQNKTITDGFVYENDLRLEGNSGPQIDALIRIGKRVLVCEIKSLIHPVTPRELSKHARTVFEDGVKQAHNELGMATRHRAQIAKCTQFEGNPANLVFCHAVLIRGGIGSGLTVKGVPILDVPLCQRACDTLIGVV